METPSQCCLPSDDRRAAEGPDGATTRRWLLSTGVAGLTLPLAGCFGGFGGSDDGSDVEPLAVPFADPAEDLTLLHDVSDTEQLDSSQENPFVAPRPDGADGKTDDSRIHRTEWGPTHLVYGPFESPERLRVQAHYDGFQGLGTVDFAVSEDSDSGWEPIEPTETVYNDYLGEWQDVGGKWRNSEFTFGDFSENRLYVRLTLSKGYHHSTPQIGYVEIE